MLELSGLHAVSGLAERIDPGAACDVGGEIPRAKISVCANDGHREHGDSGGRDLLANTADELVDYARKVAAEGKPMTHARAMVRSHHPFGEQMSRRAAMTHVPQQGWARRRSRTCSAAVSTSPSRHWRAAGGAGQGKLCSSPLSWGGRT